MYHLQFRRLLGTDLTAEFCESFHNDLLANMDVEDVDATCQWFNYGDQRPQVNGRKRFALIGRLAPLNLGSKFGVQGNKLRMADRVVSLLFQYWHSFVRTELSCVVSPCRQQRCNPQYLPNQCI